MLYRVYTRNDSDVKYVEAKDLLEAAKILLDTGFDAMQVEMLTDEKVLRKCETGSD